MHTDDRLLAIEDLKTSFFTYVGEVKAVDGVSFDLDKAEAIAIVGESGCGKTVTAMSILRLIPPPGRIVRGRITLDGQDLLAKSERDMQQVRGNDVSMIFQDPMTSLNPVLTIGLQIMEPLILHQGMSKEAARQRAVEMLELVGIPHAARRVNQYPHQFSGGMRQRAMIAMALACNPKLLLADEPTTSLDVTIQAQIIELMKDLKQKLSTSIILITHDLGIVAGLCSRVLVMYAGKIIETGPIKAIYHDARHPYTWGLLKSVPRLDALEKRRLVPILGQPPDLLRPPAGCRFHPRCGHAMHICLEEEPELFEAGDGHRVACWLTQPQAAGVLKEAMAGGR
ncbi:MAG: ABC transporter ATP-binding protein [Bacillota bacterium]